MIPIIMIVILLAVYLFLLHGRSGHEGLKALRQYHYAHRGLHGDGVPENSMAAFRRAREQGFGIELDIHLLQDGNLAVIHDAALKRTTGAEGYIEDLTVEDLKDYRLEGTEETIPTFREVLDLYAGAAPLIVELKAERKNHAALTEAACNMLSSYEGPYCIESFDPRCILWLRKNRPEVIRGQLSQNFLRDNTKLSLPLKFLLTQNLLNFLTRPDFLAYRYEQRKCCPGLVICQKLFRMQLVGWTIREKEVHAEATEKGWLSIFEKFVP